MFPKLQFDLLDGRPFSRKLEDRVGNVQEGRKRAYHVFLYVFLRLTVLYIQTVDR